MHIHVPKRMSVYVIIITVELGRLSEAEQYLSQVQWLVLQSPSPAPSLLASLYRNLGQLSAAQGKLAEARRHLAEDVGYST